MKSFEIKTYSKNGVFKKNINPRNIVSEISFDEILDGGQCDLSISVVGDLDDFLCSDIVEIREVDDDNTDVSRTYTGIVEERGFDEFEEGTLITLQVLGLFTILNDILYKNGSDRVFSKTGTPGEIVTDIIDMFNIEHGSLSGDTQNISTSIFRYTQESIDISGDDVSIDFDNISCLDAIKNTIEGTGYSFFIGSDGVVFLQKDSGQRQVTTTLGREIIQISVKYHKKEMKNTLFLEREGGIEKTYSNNSAIDIFGRKEKKEVNSEILDVTTQDTKGEDFVSEYGGERNEIVITSRPLKTTRIVPGDMITIQNSKFDIQNKKITKISKQKESWTIYIGDFLSFGNLVLKK